MKERIFIKPTNPDVKVRKLRGGHLNEHGEYVPREVYYLKRIKDGDAALITNEADIKKALAKAKADTKKAAEAVQQSTDKEA